jgi:dynamin 1-like protein
MCVLSVREQMLPELMRETEDIAVRRQECVKNKEMLQRAMEIINEVRDFKSSSAAASR